MITKTAHILMEKTALDKEIIDLMKKDKQFFALYRDSVERQGGGLNDARKVYEQYMRSSNPGFKSPWGEVRSSGPRPGARPNPNQGAGPRPGARPNPNQGAGPRPNFGQRSNYNFGQDPFAGRRTYTPGPDPFEEFHRASRAQRPSWKATAAGVGIGLGTLGAFHLYNKYKQARKNRYAAAA